MPIRNNTGAVDLTKNLLDKFEKVTPTDNLGISDTDKAVLEKELSLYTEQVKKLEKWNTLFDDIEDMNAPNSRVTLTEYSGSWRASENYQVKQKEIDENKYSRTNFYPQYAKAKLLNLISETKELFAGRVIGYFVNTYNLKSNTPSNFFTNDLYKHINKEVHYKPLVKQILEELGGVKLADMGIINLKTDLAGKLWRADNIQVQPQKLILKTGVWYDNNYSGGFNFGNKVHEFFSLLEAAFGYFEFGKLGNPCIISNAKAYSKVDFDNPYLVIGGNRVESIKFFKNRKMEIKFAEKGDADEFFHLLDLHKLQ